MLICPEPQTLEECWSSDSGAEFLDKWFGIPKVCQYFSTLSPVPVAHIDGCPLWDLIVPLFFNDNTGLHNLIRKCLILPCLTVSFHPSFMKWRMHRRTPDGSTETGWRHSPHPLWRDLASHFASLAVNVTPVRNETSKLFTSIYDNFIQTAGIRDWIRDGVSYCTKILSDFCLSMMT
jgi:hypothetical protein